MPPAIPIVAALAASGLGAAAGAGAAEIGGGLLATDILGSSLGATLGGALGGGAAGALMDKSDPLLGGVLGGVGGAVGGPGIATGVESAATSVGNALGIGSSGLPGGTGDVLQGAAAPTTTGVTASTLPATSATAGPVGGVAGAATSAAPAGVTAAPDLTTGQTALSQLGAGMTSGGAPIYTGPTTGLAGSLGDQTPGLTSAPTATGVANSLGVQAAGSTPAAPAGAAAGGENIAFSGPTDLSGNPLKAAQLFGSTPSQGSSVDQFISNPTWGGAGNILKSNPSAVIGALGLGYDVMHQGSVPGMSNLQNAATEAQRTSQQLNSYINTGDLPPGFTAAMNQAKQAAKAQVRSKYASMGMSGSTPETQDLANVDVQAVAAQAQVAAQLLQSGISESGVAQQLLASIVNINQEQDTATAQAISNFAAAMGGTPILPHITIGG
jgi:hypothetical protein